MQFTTYQQYKSFILDTIDIIKKSENNKKYKVYAVQYPVGNGIFNIDKSIEDIKWIIDNELQRMVV